MNELRARLLKCFSAVFPRLTEEEILVAAPGAVESWDSLASITLVTVIEEEFKVQVDPEDIEQLVSFEMTLEYVMKKQAIPA